MASRASAPRRSTSSSRPSKPRAVAADAVTRIFVEVPLFDKPEDGATPERCFDAWVSVKPDNERRPALDVHVGKHLIDTHTEPDSVIAREAMHEIGATAMRLDAVAWGSKAAQGWITVGLPGRK